MEETDFLFRCRPLTGDELVPQIAAALEKRTEQQSREQYPAMWQCTDHLRARRLRMTPKRQQLLSGAELILALLLVLTGLFHDPWLPIPVVLGAAAALFCLRELLKRRRAPHSRFEVAARHLLSVRGLIADDEVRVRFTPDAMIVEQPQGKETVSYAQFEAVYETDDIYLAVYEGQILLLLKRDLDGERHAFSAFLEKKVTRFRL